MDWTRTEEGMKQDKLNFKPDIKREKYPKSANLITDLVVETGSPNLVR